MSDIPPASPEFSVIIVSYNTRDMTLACLSSVYAQTEGDFEVVVVDNASTDGSPEAIRRVFPEVTLVMETINHGFGPAHHVALPYCRAPWLVLLNPDTVVLDGALDKLMAFSRERPKAGIWGGRTLFADGSLNLASCWHRQTLWSLFCHTTALTKLFPHSSVFNAEAYGGWQRDDVREVDIVSGCFFLISRETWDSLGGFDPVFSMYGEEADLCLRAHETGLRPAITPTATIIHYGGASENIRSDKLVRSLQAKAELIKRHFSPGTRGLALILFRLWPLSRHLVSLVWVRTMHRHHLRDKASTWRDIWHSRAEWCNGF